MTNTARIVGYYGQNGHYRLTPKQRRRVVKKDWRDATWSDEAHTSGSTGQQRRPPASFGQPSRCIQCP